MALSTSTSTLAVGASRTFNLSPGSALTLVAPPNVRATVTETPNTVSASGVGGNSSRIHNLQLGQTVTYGPYEMGGTVVVANASNSGTAITWVRSDALVAESASGAVSLVSGDRILPVLHFKPTTGTTRRTSTNTVTDTVEQVLDTYIIPAGAVDINDAVETHFIGKTNTGIVAANFTLRMNGVSILATTGNASNAINSMVSKIWNTGVLNAQQSLPTSNLNQGAGQGSVSGTMASYSIDFSADVIVTLSVVFASTASGMWAERQYIASMVR
jgi:hypothetical protein